MKSYFYVLALLGLTFISANASGQAGDAFALGLKGGLSIPSLKAGETENDWNKDYVSREGVYFALTVEYRLSKYFYFQPELAYAAEGGKRKGIQPMSIPSEYLGLFQLAFSTKQDYLYANLNSVSKLNYLQLPLLFKFQYPIALKGRLQAFAQVGPYVGYLLISKQEVHSGDLHVYLDGEGKNEIDPDLVHKFFGSDIDTVIEARDELHRWNVGIQGGIGLAWIFGKNKVFIEGGGNYGFVPVQKSDDHGKNNIGAATVLIGYLRNIRL
ncbi:MAG TPA: porin family protein [Edaphocola sp.]|nr:porin family protein [Edaphocola sp.]